MLPGGADMTKARIWFTGTDSIRVNGVETANGSKIENLTENSILNIGWNNSEFDVNIMKGSEMQSAPPSGRVCGAKRPRCGGLAAAMRFSNGRGSGLKPSIQINSGHAGEKGGARHGRGKGRNGLSPESGFPRLV